MERTQLEQLVQKVFRETKGNQVIVEREDGSSKELRMFDEPLMGIGSAEDPLFMDYKKPEAVGAWHRSPREWLPEARTVLSFFFPISEEAKRSNRSDPETPSLEWLYSRIEGNEFLRAFIVNLRDALQREGYPSCAPAADERFQTFMGQKPDTGTDAQIYGSMWSERHVAYLCGLGTFGLSKGIITKKGMAGRFCSLVTALETDIDIRPYQGLYDYCIRCGKCIERCPVHAISEDGKEHLPCHRWLMHTKKKYAPRLGCGKCQTAVPCESRIPGVKERFSDRIKSFLSEDEWLIVQDSYNPEENLKYESLFCLTNGYLGTRGCHEEGTAKSIPCTYINGVFDKSETFMRELANMPDWLVLRLYTGKELIGIENCEILSYTRVLDMRHACLAKSICLRDRNGRETLIEGIRFISRQHVHRMALRLYVTPLNYSGIIEAESIIDGTVINFCDAPRFKVKHIRLTANEPLQEQGIYLEVATRDSHLHEGCGAVFQAVQNGKNTVKSSAFHEFGEQVVEFHDFDVHRGETVELTKYVVIYTEREARKEELKETVGREMDAFTETGFEEEFSCHKKRYQDLWKEADIRIAGDDELNKAVRFNIFHLMSTASESDSHVNIGAKLLHGEEYGGHAFWDTELFMLPFFDYVFPHKAANLVDYRYHLLDAARRNAEKNGYRGAQYPWESADDGTEQCPDWTIEPDGTCYRCYVAVYEHHVTAAVAFGVANYVKITGDMEFLLDKGAEILMETARFWASRCQYVKENDRYEIRQVTGPDEWHEPVDNNVYTNYLARWNLRYAVRLSEMLKKDYGEAYERLKEKTGLTEEEIQSWDQVQGKIWLPAKEGTQLLEQFEGYFDLEEVVIEQYDKNDWPVKPEALKHRKISQTQIIKQADVVMLLYLLGEEFEEEMKKLNYSFYEKRTLHGSSLSPAVYAIMGLRVGDGSKAYRYLRRAAFLDLLDLQKNTREGIHAANAGGVWQTVVFGFAGVSLDEKGVLHISPNLPEEWEKLVFRIHCLGAWLEIEITLNEDVKVTLLGGDEVEICINGQPGNIYKSGK